MKGDKSIVELSEQRDVHANQITERNRQLLAQAEGAFLTEGERKAMIHPEHA